MCKTEHSSKIAEEPGITIDSDKYNQYKFNQPWLKDCPWLQNNKNVTFCQYCEGTEELALYCLWVVA